jgi:Protein of unknown function (DUF3052)
MGLEATCDVRLGRKRARGRAHLDAAGIQFRGDAFRLAISLRDVRSVEVRRGCLRLELPEGTASFELGPAAEAWALKIRYPRSRADKLGIKPGQRVSVLGIDDPALREELRERSADVREGRLRPGSDLVFFGVERQEKLSRLRTLRASLKADGAVWVVWPKGRKAVREDDVRRAALAAGLVDVKVVSFSDDRSGLKLVIPLSQR